MSMPPPPGMQGGTECGARFTGDLTLPTLVRMTLDAWSDNPVARRLWRLMRRTVIALFALSASGAVISMTVALMQPVGAAGGPGIGYVLLSMVGGAASSAVGLITLAVPFLYPSWAYRKSWTDDPMLRTAAMGLRGRVVGIFAPLVLAAIVVTGVNLVAAPVALISAVGQMEATLGSGFGKEPITKALAALSGFTASLAYLFTYPLACVTIGLRRLINHGDPAGARSRGFMFVARPVIRIILASVAISFVRGLPFLIWFLFGFASVTSTGVAGTPPAAPRFEPMPESYWVASYLALIAIDAFQVFVFHLILTPYWRSDLGMVMRVLFDAEPERVPPPPMIPPPPSAYSQPNL